MIFNGKEYVYEIYRERSFSTAAQKLYVTQPALSNKIKRIEDEIGSPIFDRSTSPIRLTEVGRAYIETVEQMIRLEENFARLEELMGELEREDIPLEEAFSAYSAGMALVKQCNDQIDKVEKQVLKLTEEGQLEEFGNGSISI